MNNKSFKLYKPKDYCENSNKFLLIKSAVILSWEEIHKRQNNQLRRVRYNIITPDITIEQLLMYSCGKNSLERNQFISSFKRAIRLAFPKFRFAFDSFNTEGYNLANKTTLLQLYNSLKNYEINSLIDINDEIKTHELYKSKYI